MPSFDIVSRANFPELDNAINNTHKAIAARFDFRGAVAEIAVDPKEKKLKIVSDDAMKVRGVREMFEHAAVKRGLALKTFAWTEPEPTVAGRLKQEAKIQDGLEQDIAKSIVKLIKDTKMKVQASIQGDEVRVTGKKIDDLQAVMKLLSGAGLNVPLQYVNMKS
jgi:uncharacterized protein YajQ (UPF0234 family)